MHYGSGSLGHEKLETTARYTRVATGLITSVESPLDRLSMPRKTVHKKTRQAKRRNDKSNGGPPA